MNQIIAAAVLFGVVTVVFAPLIAESGSQIFTRSESISGVMDRSRQQVGQVLVATHVQGDGAGTAVYLSNIGPGDIGIRTVLVDGEDSAYVLRGPGAADTLESGGLYVLEAGPGSRIQVVTDTGKLFEFNVP